METSCTAGIDGQVVEREVFKNDEHTVTQFLRGGVQNLPAIISFGEIVSLHPGLNPTVEVPKVMKKEDRDNSCVLPNQTQRN